VAQRVDAMPEQSRVRTAAHGRGHLLGRSVELVLDRLNESMCQVLELRPASG
jgi:hypothetical protein